MAKKVTKEKSPLGDMIEKIRAGQTVDLKIAKMKIGKLANQELFDAIAESKTLATLEMQNNQLGDEGARQLGRVIRQNTSLTKLDVSNNGFTSLGAKIITDSICEENWTLTTLIVQEDGATKGDDLMSLNSLFDISEFVMRIQIATLSNINFQKAMREKTGEARLNRRGLSQVPQIVMDTSAITKLDLSLNAISSLPIAFCSLSQLEVLFLNGNKLASLPVEIGRLINLRKVNLSGNQLRDLPNTIGLWKAINHFDIDANQITDLPLVLGSIATLQTLKCMNNPISRCNGQPISKEILKGGDSAVLSFLHSSVLSGTGFVDTVKLMFVGNGNVGKTSLIKSFMSPKFRREPTDKNVATDGIEISDWPQTHVRRNADNVDEQCQLNFKAWDFAGQDLYYVTHQFFLSPQAIYLLCFNMLEAPETNRIHYWLHAIKVHAPKAAVVLVGTHADRMATGEPQAYFSNLKNLLANYTDNIKLTAMVSTATGDFVRELVQNVKELAVQQPWYHEQVPRNYLTLLSKIESLRLVCPLPVMHISDLFQVALDCKIQAADFKAVTDFLVRMGELVYFGGKRSELSEMAVLDPQWLARTFSHIVSMKHSFVKEGVLLMSSIKHVWHAAADPSKLPAGTPYNEDEVRRFILSMFQRFDLLHPLSDVELLVPSLLPQPRPRMPVSEPVAMEIFQKRVWHLFRVFELEFVPSGFFTKWMVRQVRRGWRPIAQYRDGFYLLNKNNTAILSLDVHNDLARQRASIISTLISRERDIAFADLLVFSESVLDLLQEWVRGLPVEVRLVCPCCLAPSITPDLNPLTQGFLDAVLSAGSHTQAAVEQAVLAGEARMRCEKCGKDSSVQALAPDLSLSGMARIPNDSIVDLKHIGKGSFAEVYWGRLGGVSCAVKRLYIETKKDDDDRPLSASSKTAAATDSNSSRSKESWSLAKSSNKRVIAHSELSSVLAEFRREALLMYALKHPGLVGLMGITLNPLALVQEYMELGALDRYLVDPERMNKIPIQLKFQFSFDIARAINFLHTFDPPIIHRDLKTPNVLITNGTDPITGQKRHIAKVADLGLAQSLGAMAELRSRVVDNPRWLAPEIIKNSSYNEKIDVYAWAIVSWEIWYQKAAFAELQWWYAIEAGILEGKRPALSPSTCPLGYCELLSVAWNHEPIARPSMDLVVNRLVALEKNVPALKDGSLYAFQGPANAPPFVPAASAVQRSDSPASALIAVARASSSTSVVSTTTSSAAPPSPTPASVTTSNEPRRPTPTVSAVASPLAQSTSSTSLEKDKKAKEAAAKEQKEKEKREKEQREKEAKEKEKREKEAKKEKKK